MIGLSGIISSATGRMQFRSWQRLFSTGHGIMLNVSFEDGKPRTLRELFPGEQRIMLGPLMSYAKGATPNALKQT